MLPRSYVLAPISPIVPVTQEGSVISAVPGGGLQLHGRLSLPNVCEAPSLSDITEQRKGGRREEREKERGQERRKEGKAISESS